MESHNQAATREARRFLADRVRNDWSFPDTPPTAWEDDNSSDDDELRGVHEFRERYYGSTDDDTVTEDEDEHLQGATSPKTEDDQRHQDAAAVADTSQAQGGATTTTSTTSGSAQPRRNSSHRKTEASKFRFEHPDAVADEMADRALRRKRRRRRRLLAEMQWNEGLATFIAQRDAWTGATAARKHLRRKASDVAAAAAVSATATTNTTTTTTTTTTSDESPATISPSSSPSAPPHPPPAGATRAALHLHNLAASDDDTDYEPPLPVAPRLLAHNPIRDSITPRSYPDIYSKIVLQSQTPKVPINLRDMTTALVQGWKADGEWPPKPGPADPLPGARNGGKSGRIHVPGAGVVGGGVGKVAAVLTGGLGGGGGGGAGAGAGGETRGADKGALASVAKGQNPNHHHQFLSHHPHVKRGVDSMRKVFRLSGSGGGHHDHGASPAA
ncbi:hypothetical protein HDK77DRAFT_229134 [Phyllosticta capitalensis]